MKVTSRHAALDVTRGRKALSARVAELKAKSHLGPMKNKGLARIPVIIHGFIDDTMNDDGISIEFEVDVTKVEIIG